jgi:hypothetical protein
MPMRRSVSRRIFAIALLLTRLLLADFMHLPAAQAAAHEASQPMMMMMDGEPCPGMGHPMPANDGTCCKSAQCPCLHAPALMVALPIPAVFSIGYADLPAAPFQHVNSPPAVFFRPPI